MSKILDARYIVIKRKDFEDYLTQEERDDITHALTMVDNMRTKEGRKSLEALVVEKDWPEYEPTLKALEERVVLENWHERNRKAEYLREYSRGCSEAMAEFLKSGVVSHIKSISAYAKGWNSISEMSVAC